MIWLTWRQFRVQGVTAAAALAVFAILLGVTGPHLSSLYSVSGIPGCHGSACGAAASNFLLRLAATRTYPVVYALGVVLIFVTPAIIGIFWGAPLIARELESGTCRLVWTQSVTRRRWLAVKLALTGLAAMAVTESFGLMHAWWSGPIVHAVGLGAGTSVFNFGRWSWLAFAIHGITPLGYAAFAFALGAATGVLVRRPLPAMAVTLAIFAVVQIAVPLWVRPHLIPPARTIVTLESVQSISPPDLTASDVPGQPGAWIISSGAISAAGQPVTSAPVSCLPPPPANGSSTLPAKGSIAGSIWGCMDRLGIRETITYEPGSRYWPIQGIETGIFLALALALAGCCFWRLGRRRA